MSERIIETVKFDNAFDLVSMLSITLMREEIEMPSTVGVELPDGRDARAFQVVEITLTDGSKVHDIRLVPWVVPAEALTIEGDVTYPVPAGLTIKVTLQEPQYRCPDCIACEKHANSDATTPGFFYRKCEKHRNETR